MNKIELIENLIKEGFPDAIVRTENLTGSLEHLHLGVFVASEKFEGKALLEQHRMIMNLLKKNLSEDLHAVKLKTMTKDKFNKLQQKEN